MTTLYKAKYRCRLCGEIYYGAATTFSSAAEEFIKEIESGRRIELQDGQIETRTHRCQDGSFGFSDFLGFEKRVKEKSSI